MLSTICDQIKRYVLDVIFIPFLTNSRNSGVNIHSRLKVVVVVQLFSEKCTGRYFKVIDGDLSSKQGSLYTFKMILMKIIQKYFEVYTYIYLYLF